MGGGGGGGGGGRSRYERGVEGTGKIVKFDYNFPLNLRIWAEDEIGTEGMNGVRDGGCDRKREAVKGY